MRSPLNLDRHTCNFSFFCNGTLYFLNVINDCPTCIILFWNEINFDDILLVSSYLCDCTNYLPNKYFWTNTSKYAKLTNHLNKKGEYSLKFKPITLILPSYYTS